VALGRREAHALRRLSKSLVSALSLGTWVTSAGRW